MTFDAYALILSMLALGIVFARLGVFDDQAAEVLNKVVLYVCLPAAILRYAPSLQLRPALLGVVAVPWLLLAATIALVTLTTRWLRLRPDQHAVLLLTVALANTSFLGYPLVRALLGEAGLPYAVVYDQFGAFLMLSTFGLYVLARYGGDRPPGVRDVAVRVLSFPPFLALLVALTVMPEDPPTFIAGALQRLADALLPLVMLAIGFSIRLRLEPETVRPLALGLALKLVVMPTLAFVATAALGMSGLMAQATVLEAAMPPMITAGALAISHRLAPALAAAMVGYGIVLSLLSLPLWAWLARHFL